MNTIELLGAVLGFVGSLSLAAAGVLLAKIRRELRSVRQAKADLLSVDTRAEQLEANGLKTVLQPCGRCEGHGVKGCVRCGDCSGDGYRSRVVSGEADKPAPGDTIIEDLSILRHQYECEREARRAAEKRCEELGAHECWCAPPDGFELVSQTVDESGSRETEFMRTATATYRPVKESSDGFVWVSNITSREFYNYLDRNNLCDVKHARLRSAKATGEYTKVELQRQGIYGLYINRRAIEQDRAEWKGLKHHLEEVAKDGEKAEAAYGFYRYDPGGSWDWTATNNHFQVFSSFNGTADGATFFLPPQAPPMA